MIISLLIICFTILVRKYPAVRALPWIILFSLLPTNLIKAQEAAQGFRLAFYNVENLMDTLDDANTNDNDFLPSAKNAWNSEKYQTKLAQLSKVVKALAYPDFVGLAEVENANVLKDLARNIDKSYAFLHFDSPDERGIDVALLYNAASWQVISSEIVPVRLPDNDYTRDILHANMRNRAFGGAELHIFVCHFPSRRAGAASVPKRMAAAQVLTSAIAEVYKSNANAEIVLMGDFNDSPSDSSMLILEMATPKAPFVNLATAIDTSNEGTLIYDNKWFVFDQILVSQNMISTKAKNKTPVYKVKGKKQLIFNDALVTFFHPKQKKNIPNRTYSQSKYHGGFSDHFAVYADFLLLTE